MDYLSSAVFVVGLLGETALFVLLIIMGKRLGQALELPKYYRFYWIAIALLLLPLPILWLLLITRTWGLPDPGVDSIWPLKVLIAFIPAAVATTLVVLATAKYWQWIWGELRSPGAHGEGSDEG
jgi:hypothetical protein